jgi:ATP synthase I chain
MTPGELAARVTLDVGVAAVVLAALGLWLGGAPAALGTLVGGALAVLNFRWLVARAAAVTAAGGTPPVAWIIGAGLRFACCAAACAVVLVAGWAHPLAVVAGFSILPIDVVVRGLAAARGDD